MKQNTQILTESEQQNLLKDPEFLKNVIKDLDLDGDDKSKNQQ